MFTFWMPTTTLFGVGKLNELHTQINTPRGAVHGKKALVVISNGKSTRANGYLDRLENELKQANVDYVVFDKVAANPTKPVVEEGGRFARENGCDFIVALGGGDGGGSDPHRLHRLRSVYLPLPAEHRGAGDHGEVVSMAG